MVERLEASYRIADLEAFRIGALTAAAGNARFASACIAS